MGLTTEYSCSKRENRNKLIIKGKSDVNGLINQMLQFPNVGKSIYVDTCYSSETTEEIKENIEKAFKHVMPLSDAFGNKRPWYEIEKELHFGAFM